MVGRDLCLAMEGGIWLEEDSLLARDGGKGPKKMCEPLACRTKKKRRNREEKSFIINYCQ